MLLFGPPSGASLWDFPLIKPANICTVRRASQSEEEWGRLIRGRILQLFKEPKNRYQGINSARLCSLAGQYDNPIPTRFLATIDCLKIPALSTGSYISLVLLRKEWIGWRNSSGGGRYIEWKRVSSIDPHRRVLNSLLRTRISRRRMFWLPPPPPPYRQQVVSLSLSSCVSLVELTDGRGGREGWGRSQIIRQRGTLILYISFNILWPPPSAQAVPKTMTECTQESGDSQSKYSLVCGASLPSWFLRGFPDKMALRD